MYYQHVTCAYHSLMMLMMSSYRTSSSCPQQHFYIQYWTTNWSSWATANGEEHIVINFVIVIKTVCTLCAVCPLVGWYPSSDSGGYSCWHLVSDCGLLLLVLSMLWQVRGGQDTGYSREKWLSHFHFHCNSTPLLSCPLVSQCSAMLVPMSV